MKSVRACLWCACVVLVVTVSILAPAEDGEQTINLVRDWSHRHVIYTNSANAPETVKALSHDPRALSAYLRRVIAQNQQRGEHRRSNHHNHAFNVDWAFSMGTPNTTTAIAASQFPAVFTTTTFVSGNPVTNPDCTNDFLVMPVNVAGGAGTANLIGVNHLYSNAAETGFCNTVTGPTVLFAYYNGATGAADATSVVLSLDGKKIAWVENSNPPIFHVLAWKSEGTVAAPIDLTTRVVASAPAAASGNVANVSLSSSTAVTNASPFIDYDHDLAYVTDNGGNVYRIKNVFCSTPGCQTTPVAPSLDSTWATNPANVGAATILTSPVLDFVTGNIYIGGANGNLYVLKSADGSAVSGSPKAFGNGTAAGGIADAPIVDGTGNGTSELVYVFTGHASASTNAQVGQLQVTLSNGALGTFTTQNVGQGGNVVHMGTPNDAYYTGTGTAEIFVCGTRTTGANPHIWQVPLNGSKIIAAPTDLGFITVTTTDVCSPITEFNNGTNDRLFLTLSSSNLLNDYFLSSGTLPAATGCSNGAGGNNCIQQATIGGATSGIVVDNNATGTAQGANVYVGVGASGNVTGGSCWTGTTGATSLALSGTSTKTAGASVATGSFTTAAAHGLAIGEMVAIAGNTNANVNGNCTVATTPSTTTFTCTYANNTAGSGTGGNVQLGTCIYKFTQQALQ